MTPGVLLLLLSSPLNRPVLAPFTVIEMWTPPACGACVVGRPGASQLPGDKCQQRGGHGDGDHSGTRKSERGRHGFLSYRYARRARAGAILAGLPRTSAALALLGRRS